VIPLAPRMSGALRVRPVEIDSPEFVQIASLGRREGSPAAATTRQPIIPLRVPSTEGAARTGGAGIARLERSSIDTAGREPVALCTWGQWVAWTTP
jgi:hypothetical protein